MSDQQGGEDEGPLTSRERENLIFLAREIVRQAGLAPDPKAEASKRRLEELMDADKQHEQSLLDFYKHMTTLSGASIVAAVAVMGALFNDMSGIELFGRAYITLGLLTLSLVLSAFGFEARTRYVSTSLTTASYDRDYSDKRVEELNEIFEKRKKHHRRLVRVTLFVWFFGLYNFLLGPYFFSSMARIW
jgi:hypothetical protein